jgi:AAA domain, putative AbiEii toxin, Type IV TA system
MQMKPTATISKIQFSGGQSFDLGPNEKIILVGSNNSGKSQSLREIVNVAHTGEYRDNVVVTLMELSKSGNSKDLETFLENNASRIGDSFHYKNWNLKSRLISYWDQPYLQLGLSAGYIKNIDANNRLTICNQQESIGSNEQKTAPQHVLYDDTQLMVKISSLFRQAFGKDIMFDFRGGRFLPIHVGILPEANLVDRVSDAYVDAVRKNPLLDKQGDGMKSYAGILLEAIVADLNVTLIDEPEAFLHPPQMRKLGETLAAEVKGQLIVATHSSDILRGFLEGTRGSVRILRLRREGNQNVVTEASADVIRELWEKPVLRYSNALEGIFHEQTIICEDDSDCRLINSVADYLANLAEDQWLDTAYVPTGGKHGIPKVASVLRQIGVPVKAVFDLDFLSEKALVQSTVVAFGGIWSNFEAIWARLDAAVRKGNKPKSIPEIKLEMKAIIDGSKEAELPRGSIQEAMKQGSPWSAVKQHGISGIPNGDAQKDFATLRDSLECLGIYLIHVGEIENFCPELGLHGPKFVTKLLTEKPLGDEGLSELHKFVTRVHKGPHNP